MTTNGAVRIAALADLHFSKNDRGSLQPLMSVIAQSADVLLLCGDLTHHGRAAEAEALLDEMTGMRMPVLVVFGNHDFHSGEQDQMEKILEGAGMHVLDGDVFEIGSVGFAGIKGFAGGFGRYVLEPWGEAMIKNFVHETVTEALKLETALARLTTPHKFVLMHYAPIQETVEGEPPEIFPFLGSNRLEDPLNRFKVDGAFHGHAHHGHPEGRTSQGIPVYNVSLPLLKRLDPERPPFRLLEVPAGAPAPS